MTELHVPGARLHYAVTGTGPVLLLIPGGNGDCGPYAPLARALCDRFTVVAYNRRGFELSPLDDGFDLAHRLAADVQDAIALIDTAQALHSGKPGPAYVFGSSSGAIVALHLLLAYPDRLARVVAHEPPLVRLLPDSDEWAAFLREVYGTYRSRGQDAAMAQFGQRLGVPEPPHRPDPATMPPELAEMLERIRVNQRFWLENELRQYPDAAPDLDALATLRDKLVLAGGEKSAGYMPFQPNLVIGQRIGRDVTVMPGDHVGYLTAPGQFPSALAAVLHEATPG